MSLYYFNTDKKSLLFNMFSQNPYFVCENFSSLVAHGTVSMKDVFIGQAALTPANLPSAIRVDAVGQLVSVDNEFIKTYYPAVTDGGDDYVLRYQYH